MASTQKLFGVFLFLVLAFSIAQAHPNMFAQGDFESANSPYTSLWGTMYGIFGASCPAPYCAFVEDQAINGTWSAKFNDSTYVNLGMESYVFFYTFLDVSSLNRSKNYTFEAKIDNSDNCPNATGSIAAIEIYDVCTSLGNGNGDFGNKLAGLYVDSNQCGLNMGKREDLAFPDGLACVKIQASVSRPSPWDQFLMPVFDDIAIYETNVAPEITSFSAMPPTGNEPLTVAFDGSAIDFNGDSLAYTLFYDASRPELNVSGVITDSTSVLGAYDYPGGDYVARLEVDDGEAMTLLSANIDVNHRPVPQFSYLPTVLFPGDDVAFNDLSYDIDGTIVRWTWDFGDSSPQTEGQGAYHSYASNGNYTVTLAVYDDLNSSDSVASHVLVLPRAGGGGGMYLGPPTPAVIIQTSGIGYLGFHPSYGLNGTRTYSLDTNANTTAIVLRVVNLASTSRTFVINDLLPKSMATTISEVVVIPEPTTVYNPDPEIVWNVTLAPQEVFEARYLFNKAIPFESFETMPLPSVTEIKTVEEIPSQVPVSPTAQTTIAGAGFTGQVVSTLSNPLIGLLVLALALVAFFLYRSKKREKK